MSIIIRLQNLPWEANSVDIRKFFSGLSIPDGGVHIVGGEKGDAFIAFQTDEDARQAFSRDGGLIRDAPVKLFLSSRTEMKSVIDQARSAVNAAKLSQQKASSAVTSASTTSSVASLPATSVHNFTSQNVTSTSFNQQQPNQQSGAFQSQYGSHVSQDPRIAVRERSRSPINRSSMGVGSVEPSGNRPNVGGTPMGGLVPISSGSGYGGAISTQTGLIPDASAGGPGWSRRGVGDFSSAGNQGNGFVPQSQGLSLNGVRPQHQQGFQAPAAQSFRLLELRGLPFTVTPREIQDFFRVGVGMFIPDDHIRILVDDRGLLTGGATVRVTNDADFNTALTMNGKLLGGRRIDVMPLVDPVAPSGQQQAPLNGGGIVLPQPIGNQIQPNIAQSIQPSPQQQQQQPPQNIPHRDYIIYMKGIPFNTCTDRDVANFFSGLRITEIIFEMDRRTGKPAGNAFVEFPSREDYEGALELNLRHMGRRYIEVFPTNREDMEDARCVANAVLAEKATFCIHITGLPPTITNADLTSYFKDAGAVPFAIHIMLKADGLNAGAAFLEFTSREHQQLAFRRDGDVINGCRISVKEFAFDEMRKIVGRPLNPPVPPGGAGGGRNGFSGGGDRLGDRGRGRGGFRGGRGGGFGGRGDRGSPPRRDPFADGHCVIHASNVPYKATNDDLRAFFQDFAVLPNGIERRLNEKGLATPEARIAFKNMLEAERAVKAMHKKHLLGRPVFLRLAV